MHHSIVRTCRHICFATCVCRWQNLCFSSLLSGTPQAPHAAALEQRRVLRLLIGLRHVWEKSGLAHTHPPVLVETIPAACVTKVEVAASHRPTTARPLLTHNKTHPQRVRNSVSTKPCTQLFRDLQHKIKYEYIRLEIRFSK